MSTAASDTMTATHNQDSLTYSAAEDVFLGTTGGSRISRQDAEKMVACFQGLNSDLQAAKDQVRNLKSQIASSQSTANKTHFLCMLDVDHAMTWKKRGELNGADNSHERYRFCETDTDRQSTIRLGRGDVESYVERHQNLLEERNRLQQERQDLSRRYNDMTREATRLKELSEQVLDKAIEWADREEEPFTFSLLGGRVVLILPKDMEWSVGTAN